MIQYICPGCRTEYRLESREKAGRIRCRVCRTPITTAELDKQEAIKVQINYMIQNQLERPELTPEESSEPAASPVSTARADLYRTRRSRRSGRRFLLPMGIVGFLFVGAVAFAALKAGGNPMNAFYPTARSVHRSRGRANARSSSKANCTKTATMRTDTTDYG